MKKHVPLLLAIFLISMISLHCKAQGKVLFVNDNGVFISNTDTVLTALSAVGIEYDLFSARDSLRSPTAAEMQSYPLVIWYCSTDGVKNYLWGANDSDNIELIVYLETGGKLWLMGTDFLYDRYGSAPDVFQPGDFVYDYLGISDYTAQSYGDDGGLGVPELDPENIPSMILELDTIRWIYSSAWWVDGCSPVASAASVYNMGPASYPLHGLSSAVYNHYNDYAGQKELTFFFDPALVDSYQNRVNLFLWSYASFFLLPPGFAELPEASTPLITGQNPVSDKLKFKVPETVAGSILNVRISDLSGKMVYNKTNSNQEVFSLDVSSFSTGSYVLSVSDDKNMYYQKFVVSR